MALLPPRAHRSFAIFCLPLLLGAAPVGGSVELLVGNVRDSTGRIFVMLCPRAIYPGPCEPGGDAPSRAGMTSVLLRNVAPGTYAAMAFHDVNGDRKLDRWLGVPREGYGFSRDQRRRPLGPPPFDAARFEHGAADQRIGVRLFYVW